ncbi:MAG: zf-HC2 domain-containing protein [Candidatus Baltobacteraceae bacterium]
MKRPHERFEALAGALLLDEASPAERAEFALHAEGCAACARDLEEGAPALAALARARDVETWRPVLLDAAVRRIEGHRRWRSRLTVNALVFAFALAFVLHVGVVTGLGAQTVAFLRAAGAIVVAQRAVLTNRAP